MKADKVIKPSKYFQMSKEGDMHTLRISEAFPEDEGQYKCIASSPGGQTVVTANLIVLGNFFFFSLRVNRFLTLQMKKLF